MSMAYTPHTWNNEVITDAKLNAIEQGVRAGTLLSGTDIDTDKDWNGKVVTNVGALETGQIDSIIPVPPASQHLVTVQPTVIEPAVLASYPGPYYHPGNRNSTATHVTYTVPNDLSAHGISSHLKLVKLSVEYSMSTGTWYSFTKVHINGVECAPLTRSHPGRYGAYTATASATIYVTSGSTLSFNTWNGSNDQTEPVISDINITLEGAFPFGEVAATIYPDIANAAGAMLTPYHFAHPETECTCDFDGALATMNDYSARPFFPQQPGTINLAWKSGNTWTATQPTLIFYRSRLSTTP